MVKGRFRFSRQCKGNSKLDLSVELAKENAELKKKNRELEDTVFWMFESLPAGWHGFEVGRFTQAVRRLRTENWNYYQRNEELSKLNEVLAGKLAELGE